MQKFSQQRTSFSTVIRATKHFQDQTLQSSRSSKLSKTTLQQKLQTSSLLSLVRSHPRIATYLYVYLYSYRYSLAESSPTIRASHAKITPSRQGMNDGCGQKPQGVCDGSLVDINKIVEWFKSELNCLSYALLEEFNSRRQHQASERKTSNSGSTPTAGQLLSYCALL